MTPQDIELEILTSDPIELEVASDEENLPLETQEFVRGGGGGGTSDYEELDNKPQINGVTLIGDKSAADLGLAAASDIPTVPVQSVNGKTGAVVLDASDVGAGTYSKPSGGIPKTDLASGVQTSLGLADTAYQKPSSGIPSSDLASGVIPTVPTNVSSFTNDAGYLTLATLPVYNGGVS